VATASDFLLILHSRVDFRDDPHAPATKGAYRPAVIFCVSDSSQSRDTRAEPTTFSKRMGYLDLALSAMKVFCRAFSFYYPIVSTGVYSLCKPGFRLSRNFPECCCSGLASHKTISLSVSVGLSRHCGMKRRVPYL
jgi:hypothetical protein